MADYLGTDDDDIIDASELPSDVTNILPGEGDDTVINAGSQHTINSGPGNDNISGKNTAYLLWRGNEGATINLKEGWSDDGYGTRDQLSGIQTIHGSGKGDIFYGTSEYEKYFSIGGDNILYMGGGDDRVSYPGGNSEDYTISLVGEEIHVIGPQFKDIIVGGRYIEFMDDNKIIDTSYLTNNIQSEEINVVYSFTDNTMTEEYTYAGVTNPPQLLGWFPSKVFLFDVDLDGNKDVIIPMAKGYAQVGDYSTYTPFIALTVNDGKLEYNENINSYMPVANTAGRAKSIFLKATESEAIITANVYNASGVKDLSLKPYSQLRLTQNIENRIDPIDIFPTLPDSTEDFPLAENAHSLAVGDINGDGLDDIYIGRIGSYSGVSDDEGYELIQNSEGSFELSRQDIYKKIHRWPLANEEKIDHINGGKAKNMHLDSELFDVNNDGFSDLLVGFGHGSASSKLFINNNGKFTEDNMIEMPDSIYGVDNQMHLTTLIADFDSDNDLDFVTVWTRYEPYYGGYYLQVNQNDGLGNFKDITDSISNDAFKDAYNGRLTWVEPWQIIDINNDGHLDIVGARSSYTPLLYINDGLARFFIQEVGVEEIRGMPHAWGDFDKDNKIEYVVFENSANSDKTESTFSFIHYELKKEIGTGPDFINTADQGIPGFNEKYYLNENSSAKEAVDAGTYATGLEHYLAEGKEAGLNIFAPFTKVHGYSGDDTIILREGDETAFGYAGKDTFEGGAGNDIIDGGAGVDTAIYKDSSSAYTLTTNDDGTVSIVHTSPSESFINEGSDTLISIEKMQFSDKTISKTSLKYQLSETVDSSENILSAHTEEVLSGTLNFNKGDNIIILDGQGKTYRGLEGNDTYFVSQLLPKSGKVSITDTEGSNIIQLPVNTYVEKSLFTKNAARLTLEDGREITISGADKFSYNVGGNITKGDKGTDLTFTEFAEVFGVYDILNSSGAQTGEISDMYII